MKQILAQLVALWILIGSVTRFSVAQTPTPPPSQKKSLDQELLEGLGTPARKPPERSSEQNPLRSKDAGEDLGQKSLSDSLPLEIGRNMRKAESFLAEEKTITDALAVQEIISIDLDRLIDSLEQRNPSSELQRQRKNSTPDSVGKNNGSQSNSEPDGSANRSANSVIPRSKQIDRWNQRIWGVLPGRVQQQMNNLANEEFLPDYEEIIRQYYESLSERSGTR